MDKEFIDSLSKDQKQNVWSAQTVRLTPIDEIASTANADLCETLSKMHSRKIVSCQLKNRSILLQNETSHQVTIKCELSMMSNASQLQYKPGDDLGVLASNRPELVDALLAKLTYAPPPDQLVVVEVLKEKMTSYSKQTYK